MDPEGGARRTSGRVRRPSQRLAGFASGSQLDSGSDSPSQRSPPRKKRSKSTLRVDEAPSTVSSRAFATSRHPAFVTVVAKVTPPGEDPLSVAVAAVTIMMLIRARQQREDNPGKPMRKGNVLKMIRRRNAMPPAK